MAQVKIEKLGQSEFDRMALPMAQDLAVVYRALIDEALDIVDNSEGRTPEETLADILDIIDGN